MEMDMQAQKLFSSKAFFPASHLCWLKSRPSKFILDSDKQSQQSTFSWNCLIKLEQNSSQMNIYGLFVVCNQTMILDHHLQLYLNTWTCFLVHAAHLANYTFIKLTKCAIQAADKGTFRYKIDFLTFANAHEHIQCAVYTSRKDM